MRCIYGFQVQENGISEHDRTMSYSSGLYFTEHKLDGTHGHSEHIGKGKEVKAPAWIEPAVIQPGAGHFTDDLK